MSLVPIPQSEIREDLRMLVGTLKQPETYQSLLTHSVWKMAFDWLQNHQNELPDDGEYELQGHDLRAIVQTVTLQPRLDRRFEAHQREIDLQCCFTDSEIIEWAPVKELNPQTEYDPEKDFTLYDVPSVATQVRMTPGTFCVFFPTDGHMPGIRLSNDQTRKVVIKVNARLLEGKVSVLGPFSIEIDYQLGPHALYDSWVTRGRFDTKNLADVNPENFPLMFSGGKHRKDVCWVNLGKTVDDSDVPAELAAHGFRSLSPEWLLASNAEHFELMDSHIAIHHQSAAKKLWIGREGKPEVICLHKDKENRRLRTHYAETKWGPHIWFVAEAVV